MVSASHHDHQLHRRALPYRFCRVKADVNEHDIANRIMRRDNFMIAMVMKDLLPTHIRIPSSMSIPFLPKSLEWSITKCVFDYAFDSKHRIKSTVLQPEKAYVTFVVLLEGQVKVSLDREKIAEQPV